MATPSFPSLTALATSKHPDGERQREYLFTKFENGAEETRARGSSARYKDITAIYRVPYADWVTILNFFDARKGGVEKFNYTHPKLGVVLVKFATDSLKWEVIADGQSASTWYQIEIHLRGQI
jgi:phage-related protein